MTVNERFQKLKWLIAAVVLSAAACTERHQPFAVASSPAAPNMLAVLDQFAAPDVPALGPAEAAPIGRNGPEPSALPDRPGRSIAQHPMLYAAEGYNTIFLVNHGKVIWTFPPVAAVRSTTSGC